MHSERLFHGLFQFLKCNRFGHVSIRAKGHGLIYHHVGSLGGKHDNWDILQIIPAA